MAAYELDHRYQYFRELLQNLSEREESLKDKLLNRDHLLSSLYNQDAMMLESGVSLTNNVQHQQPQQPSSLLHVQQTNKAIPTRKDGASKPSKKQHASHGKSIMIGAGPTHPVTKSAKNKNKANNSSMNNGEAVNNPYQNQLVQKPWIQANKKQNNGQQRKGAGGVTVQQKEAASAFSGRMLPP